MQRCPQAPLRWTTAPGGVAAAPMASRRLLVDSSGKIYVGGGFRQFQTSATSTLRALGAGVDAFLAQYDASGALKWLISFGGKDTDEQIRHVTHDRTTGENPIFTGEFRGKVSFGNTAQQSHVDPTTKKANTDVFVTRLDLRKSGASRFAWTGVISSPGEDRAGPLAVEIRNKIYLAAHVRGAAQSYNGRSVEMPGVHLGGADIVFMRLHDTGHLLWSYHLGSAKDDFAAALSAELTAGGHMFAGINYQADLYHAKDPRLIAKHQDKKDAALLKMSKSAPGILYKWTLTFVGPDDDEIHDVRLSPDYRDVYVAGSFQSQIQVPFPKAAQKFQSRGGVDMFVARVTALGEVVWFRSFGGLGEDRALAVAASKAGHIYVTGSFQGAVAFDQFTLKAGIGETHAFLLKMGRLKGTVTQALSFSGSANLGLGLELNGQDQLHMLGALRGAGCLGQLTTPSQGTFDHYLLQFNGNAP